MRRVMLAILFVASTHAFATSQTRTSAFEYDAGTGLLTKEIIEPDDPSLCLVTTYSYDAFGNKTGATTRNCNGSSSEAAAPTGDPVFASRTSATSFAATGANPVAGQFPTTSTNALSQTEAKEFDARFGTVTKLTGPNGLATTWTYDNFGRKASETRADGTSTTWAYTLCGTCPAYGKYYVTQTSTGAPAKNIYYDALDREIRSEVQGFDGTYVRKDTQYDTLGRVAQVSRPYKAGDTALWTVYAYDILGRVTQMDEPAVGGNAARTVTAYNALVTTVTVSNAGAGSGMPGGVTQTRTTTRNSQGQVVTVADTQSNTVSSTYDPFGNLLTTNAGGVTTTLTYDLRGRKTQMADPDMGAWSYAYNALGELIRQVDAKNQTTTMAYDLLGRMTTRTEPDLISSWTYDSCTKGVGKLCSVSSDNGYARSHGYDSLGRPSTLSVTVDTSYSVTTTYVASGAHQGKVDTLTCPTGFVVQHLYNAYGYLHKVQDTAGTPLVFWQANSQNAAGQVTGETLGNGLTASRSHDALFRLTAASATDGSSTPHSQSFSYDPIGNLVGRSDLTQSVTESFAYDSLNRLSSASGSGLTTRSFDYSAIGNLTYKSDVGNYTYPGAGAARPHAVSSVTGSGNPYTVTASYSYDANGSLTGASGTLYPASGSVAFSRTLSYTSYNHPGVLTHVQGGSTYSYTYTYNAEHERVRLVTVRPSDTLTSIYVHPAGKGALLYEKETRASDGLVEHKHYVNGGAGLVGVYVTKSAYGGGDGPQMRYYHKDHLGSIAVITNPAGAVLERLAYEAFGERRHASGAPEDRGSPLVGVTTDRGFTGHEHLDEMMLVHMNGRIYDPVIARFMTADPHIAGIRDLQSYNRYSYVNNNPLVYTDPTGYFKLKSLFKAAAVVAVAVFAPEFLASNFSWAGSAWGASEIAAAGYSLTTAGSAAVGFTAGVVAGGNLESGFKGALTYGLGAAFTPYLPSGTLGEMVGSGINGYLQTGSARGLVRGFASGAIPKDLGFKDAYLNDPAANIGIGIARDGLRGGIVGGKDGILRGIAIGQGTNAIGHLVGFTLAGFQGPDFYVGRGAFIYDRTYLADQGAISIGNVISGSDEFLSRPIAPGATNLSHELAHIPQARMFGATYLLVHGMALSVTSLLPGGHHGPSNVLECSPSWISVPAGRSCERR